MRKKRDRHDPAATITVVGVGNIGSHLIRHLGYLPGIRFVNIIDRGAYEAANLSGQDIGPRDVHQAKARVQARHLCRRNPQLGVTPIVDAVENVPPGRLRGRVILACVDSPGARRYINEVAWRLGVSWIDAGVHADGLLARVTVFVPGPDVACLECGWGEELYAAQAQAYACAGQLDDAHPTNAPSALGALAASLQALECMKLILNPIEPGTPSREVVVDAATHKLYATRLMRNPRCRFDHGTTWPTGNVAFWPLDTAVQDALVHGCETAGANGTQALWVEGKAFVTSVCCTDCGARKKVLRLEGRLRKADVRCRQCGGEMVPVGFELLESVRADMPGNGLGRSFRDLGLRPGDIVSVGNRQGACAHYEIVDGD